jgi:hypothetical protein
MLELAYNLNGEPFEAPPTTAGWRVRKLKSKGAPEVVFGRDGLPLFLPMDADIEDLRRESRDIGKFRLDPVDDHNRQIPNAPASYVCVPPIERTPEPAAPAPAPPPASTAPGSGEMVQQLVSALLESQKQHTELARMYVSQFPVVANAMAGVVRSAGDAGLTARVPLVLPAAPEVRAAESAKPDEETDDDETDDDETDETDDDEIESDPIAVETAAQPEYSWARVAQTFADHVTPHVGPLLEGLPGLAAMLGAKRASTASDAARGPDHADPAPAEAESRAPSGPALGFDAGLLVRLNAIKARLTPDEREFAQMLIDEIAPEELPIWMGRLRSMSLDEAVAYVREKYRQGQAAADSVRPAAATAPTAVTRSGPPRAAVRSTAPSAPSDDVRRECRRPMPAPVLESAAPAAVSAAKRAIRRPTPSNGLGLLDEGTQAHLAAIDYALTLDEAAALRKQFAALPPRERASWVATLVLLPVADAVAAIRAQLAAADATVVPASPTLAPPGPEMPDAPAASVAIAPAPSASPPGESASSAGTSVAGPAAPASTHDLPAPSALATEPLGAYATAPNDPAYVGIERNADLHLAEIERALTPDERVQMHAMFSRLAPDERDVWLDKLLSAPASQGTAMLRDALGEDNAQPRTTAPPISGPPVAIAATLAPEHASALHEPGVEITELDDTADLDGTAELAEAEPDRTAELDEVAEIIELDDTGEADEAAELGETAHREDEPTCAVDPAHHAHTADDLTPPHGADPVRADHDARPTTQSAPGSRAPGAASATADADPGHHLAAIEAALTLAEKMRAHELAAQRPAAELRRWYAELLRLSVPDAVAKIRAELARSDADPRATKTGGAS